MSNTAAKELTIDFASPIAGAEASAVPAVVEAAPPPAPLAGESSPILGLIERASRDPNVDIDKMERLIAMHERVQARAAQVEYDNAMSDAQAGMKAIRANLHNKQTNSDYASYAQLDKAVRPIYSKHGFSLSFDTTDGAVEWAIRIVCKVSHRGGHREIVRIDMPADGKGAKGGDVMTKTHATGAAITYGKRYLLGMIFNLAVGQDDDGNSASSTSWGPGGKQGAIDQAREDGLMENAPKASAEQIKNMHKFIATTKGTVQLSGQTPDSLSQFWNNCRKRRAQIEEVLPAEYEELERVYMAALSAAQDRLG